MNILHLSNVIGEKKGGGVHEVVSNLYKYQKLLQHEPHIWYPGLQKDSDSIALDDNIKALKTFGNNKYKIIQDIFTSLPNEVQNYDIIHQHGIWTSISLYSQKIRRQLNIKSVIQPHGYLDPYRMEISKYKKKLMYLFFEKNNIIHSDVIIACSEPEALYFKKIFYNKDVAIIPNGIPLDFVNSLNTDTLNLRLKTKHRLLFISQIIPLKGLDRLFKVIANIGIDKFSNYEFIISGYGDNRYIISLIHLVNNLKINNLVSFIDPQYAKNKIDLFDSADFFIFPSYNENYGIVVAEALARKIPVLATKGTPWEELNTHNCGFWVDNNNEGIKSGLLKILHTSEQDRIIMGERGKELIKTKYLWDYSAKKTIELYLWILNKGTKPSFVI